MTPPTRHGYRIWVDEVADSEVIPKPLSRAEARVLVAQDPPVSPWRVVAVQAVVGGVVALLAWLLTGRFEILVSALYGAVTVVVPATLMARGTTSRLSSLTPVGTAASFMLWEFLKLGVSVALLMLAPRLVPNLSWPALLVALVLCIKVYWVALAWRGRRAR